MKDRQDSALESLFRTIVDEHQAGLIRLCRGYEADDAQRQELQQEVFLQIWRALPTHVLTSRKPRPVVQVPNDAEDLDATLSAGFVWSGSSVG